MPNSVSMVHLHVHSWYSFLEGASKPGDLVEAAAAAGQEELALTDTHSVSGMVDHAFACRHAGIKAIIGATIHIDEFPLVFLCANHEGYANLCDLLSLAHYRTTPEDEPYLFGDLCFTDEDGDNPVPQIQPSKFREQSGLTFAQLQDRTDGLFCLTGDRHGAVSTWGREGQWPRAVRLINQLKQLFPARLFMELTHHRRPGDAAHRESLTRLAADMRLHTVATGAVRHATREGYALHDALTCARLGITVTDPHPVRPVNSEAYLRNAEEMLALGFSRASLANTVGLAAECNVKLLADRVIPPAARLPEGKTARQFLRDLCYKGLHQRYGAPGDKNWTEAHQTLKKELDTIEELHLEEFFLVVREIMSYARANKIRCAGRGSAASSVVAYVLEITNVDPIDNHLLFERFLHTGRKGMPDIDVDFETHRRREVIDWMEQRFGGKQTAMVANKITFQMRMAVREMAKVLGFPTPIVDKLTKVVPHMFGQRISDYEKDLGEVLGSSTLLQPLMQLVAQLHGCPRHLSLHSGGMILSRDPLRTFSPVQRSANGVRQLQFDKDDVERLGLIKFDVLGLRTMSVITEAVDLLKEDTGIELDVDHLPLDDEPTFQLIRDGKTMSVFQIESGGQLNLLSRTQPQCFKDLIPQVALFRPGPLQGNMVDPFVARHRGLAPAEYDHPSLIPVLKDTYGLILYQEQVLSVANAFAGFSMGEADELRRLMSRFRSPDDMENIREQFVKKSLQKHSDATPKIANLIFDKVSRFVGFGFCRSHAAAFAEVVYQTAYLKTHYPAAYMAAVLEHKPGFYPLNTVLEEARHCGVRMLPPDVTRSDVKYRLERGAIRISLTQINGISAEEAANIVDERNYKPFQNLDDLYSRIPLSSDAWLTLARSGALDAFGHRRRVLWQIGELIRRDGASGYAQYQDQTTLDSGEWLKEAGVILTNLTPEERTKWDFATQGLTAGPHPVACQRTYLNKLKAQPIKELRDGKPGTRIRTAGIVIARQRPPTAKGMVFLMIEDETSRIQMAMTPPVYEKYGRAARESTLLIEGKLEGAGPGQVGYYRSVMINRLRAIKPIDGGYASFPGQMAR